MAALKIFRVPLFAGVFCLTGLAHAQSVDGPVMGFVLEKSAGIRALRGMPGAATLGPALARDLGYTQIAFAQQRDYALGITQIGAQVVLLQSLTGRPRAGLMDLPAGVERVATSPSGDAAAFYYAGSRSVLVVTGLPDSPVVSWSLEAPGLQGGSAALAVSDGGAAVLIAGGAQVYWMAPDLGARFLAVVGGSPSVAFLAGSSDAVVADGTLSRVMLVRDPKGEAQVSLIGDAAQSVSRPVAVAASLDNRRVFVANGEPGGVVSLSLAGEDSPLISCDCTPTGLDRLAGESTFRLTEAGKGPVWIVEGAGSTPRTVFVPFEASSVPMVPLRPPVRQPVRVGPPFGPRRGER